MTFISVQGFGNVVADAKRTDKALLATIATNSENKAGEKFPNFFNVVVSTKNEKLAEKAEQLLTKGTFVKIGGKLTSFKDKNGHNQVSISIQSIEQVETKND
jgi:single-stranded DNA-binding protein